MPLRQQRFGQLLDVELDDVSDVVLAVDAGAQLGGDASLVDGGDERSLPALVRAVTKQAFLLQI